MSRSHREGTTRIYASIAASAVLALSGQLAAAGTYELSVSRAGSNVYKVDGKRILIETRYCYVYAYSESAILKYTGLGGDLIFLDSKDKCDVKAVYGATSPKPGKYAVTVSREEDNWYHVFGTNTYIKTYACLSLALAEDAVLSVAGSGAGTLVFTDDDDSCMVEGVYSQLKL